MKNILVLLVLIYASSSFAYTESEHEEMVKDFKSAAKLIKYMKPSEVKEFPKLVLTELDKEKCLIPVVPGMSVSTGWAKGKFADKDQTDWAILCSNNGKSKIKVVWGGNNKPCPDSFNLGEDKQYLQTQVNGIEFSRMVATSKPKEIISYLKRWSFTLWS